MTLGRILDIVFLPVRIFFSHEIVNRIGLRSIRDERCEIVMQHAKGRLLDIGCGSNHLVTRYGHASVGVDVFDSGNGAVVLKDTSQLSFADASFETVSFVASLNHIPHRAAVLREAHRLLGKDGVLLITMLSPFIGRVRHKLTWLDKDQTERGMKKGELMGMSQQDIISLVTSLGFRFINRKTFVLRLNNLYVFERC